jgi:hypothetical protein
MMQALPAIAPGAGCPNFVDTEDGVTVIWLGCNASQPDTGCVFAAPQEKQRRVVASRRDARAAWGDDVMSSLTFPQEFRQVQAHYPIVFRATGDAAGFEALALFGFERGENLFLGSPESPGWDAAYVPLNIERRPFLIGRHGDELNIHIDIDHPRVSRTEGQELFLPHGGTSPYLERIHSVLRCSSTLVTLTSTQRTSVKPARRNQRSRAGTDGRYQTLRICA